MSGTEDIRKALADAGAEADEEQAEKLRIYMERILEKNGEINLTRITEPDEFIRGHFADSAAIAGFPEYRSAKRVIDVGTGAGFPGMVLAVLSPEKEFVLLDSLAKRLKVIEAIAEEIGADNVSFVHARAEEAGRDPALREQFDLAVSRAVAKMPVLAELCVPFVKPGGAFLAYKSENAAEEIRDSARALKILGAGEPYLLHSGVKDLGHLFAAAKKQENTPGAYPRKAGTPSRKPL